MTAFLTLMPLLAPGVAVFDELWMGALWALHGASSDKTYFYRNRMPKISTLIERQN
jgi:hypothetical protein